MSIAGESWSKEAVRIARYHSTAAHFERDTITIRYGWAGDNPRESLNSWIEAGEIRFFPASVEKMRGRGFYTSTNLHDPSKTTVQRTGYVRANADEVEALRARDRANRSMVIAARLKARDESDV